MREEIHNKKHLNFDKINVLICINSADFLVKIDISPIFDIEFYGVEVLWLVSVIICVFSLLGGMVGT